MFAGIPECNGLSKVDSTVTVDPVAQPTTPDNYGNQYMLFMAMAFKSVSEYITLHFGSCDAVVDHVM